MLKKFITKYKKRVIVLGSLWVIYLIIIFSLGYKIPWFDKHPDWGYFPNHTNPDIVIERVLENVSFETVVQPKGRNEKYILAYKNIRGTSTDSFYIFNWQFNLLFSDMLPRIAFSPGFYPDTANNTVIITVRDTTNNSEIRYHLIEYNLGNFTKKELPQSISKTLNDSIANTYRLLSSLYMGDNKNAKFEHLKYLDCRVTGNKFQFGSGMNSGFSNTGGGERYNSKGYRYSSEFKQSGLSYFEINLGNRVANFKMSYNTYLGHYYEFNSQNKDTVYLCYIDEIYKIYKRI